MGIVASTPATATRTTSRRCARRRVASVDQVDQGGAPTPTDLASGTGTTTIVERQTCSPSASVLAARAGEFPQISAGHVTDLLLDHSKRSLTWGLHGSVWKQGDAVTAWQPCRCSVAQVEATRLCQQRPHFGVKRIRFKFTREW